MRSVFKKVEKKVELCALKSTAYQYFPDTLRENIRKMKKVLDKPLTVCYIVYVEWLRDKSI